MSTLIEITNCFIEVAIYLFFLNRILTPKKIPFIAKASVLTASMLIHIIRSFLVKTTYPNYIITFVLFTSTALLLYQGSVFKRLGGFFLYFFVLLSSDVLARSLLSVMFDISNTPMQHYTGLLRYIGMSIVTIITFTILALISSFFKKHTAQVDIKYWIITALFPIFSLFIVVSCDIFLIISGTSNINHAALLSVIMLCLLFFNTILFEFMESYSANLQLEKANLLISQQEENYTNVQISENELSRLRHDILNHISTMETMLSESKFKDAEKLLEDLKNSPQLSGNLVYTNDSALDAILNFNAKKAESLGINYLVKTNGMSTPVNMTPLDKSTVLSNALTNAFEACESMEEKFVVVTIASDNDKFKICIENSSPAPKTVNGIFVTTKSDFKRHGYGITSMKSALEKYNGNLSITHKDGITTLTIIADN